MILDSSVQGILSLSACVLLWPSYGWQKANAPINHGLPKLQYVHVAHTCMVI